MKKARILMVEDDMEMCEELIPILEGSGYRVEVAHDGKVAIALLEKDDFGMLLLDLKMPGISGYEVLKWVKKIHPQIKVLVLSGSPLRPDQIKEEEQVFPTGLNYDKLIEKSADAFITKPFDVEQLLRRIKKMLPPK